MMRPVIPAVALLLLGLPAIAAAEDEGYHPYFKAPQVRTVDLSAARHNPPAASPESDGVRFDQLDEFATAAATQSDRSPGQLPTGLVQQGNVVVPAGVASGELTATHRPIAAVEDIPGNKYPRKHTVYLNFTGGMLFTGSDNSAESRSSLARQGVYPTFSGGESTALAAVQAFENDVAQFGVVVEYAERPEKTAPYTMVMIGGNWTDTNIEEPAGGVAPGTDCGALGQRHVVYVFGNNGGTSIANVSSQEAGHAWGLDHSLNCGSVMAYCGGGNQSFSTTCDGVCEQACQGKAGCFATHEMFCGEGDQNEAAELNWIFGGNEPDLEPPTVDIVSPTDGATFPDGASINFRTFVDDNYGGFGWKFIITHEGEEIYNEVDYDRDVDEEYRAALNLVNLDPGTYVLTVEAEDQYDHIVSQSVTITVEGEVIDDTDTNGGTDGETDPADTDDPTGQDTDGGGSNGSSNSGTAGEEGSASNSGTAGASDTNNVEDDDSDEGSGSSGAAEDGTVDRGCGCVVTQDPSPWGALLLLGFAALRRRRE